MTVSLLNTDVYQTVFACIPTSLFFIHSVCDHCLEMRLEHVESIGIRRQNLLARLKELRAATIWITGKGYIPAEWQTC